MQSRRSRFLQDPGSAGAERILNIDFNWKSCLVPDHACVFVCLSKEIRHRFLRFITPYSSFVSKPSPQIQSLVKCIWSHSLCVAGVKNGICSVMWLDDKRVFNHLVQTALIFDVPRDITSGTLITASYDRTILKLSFHSLEVCATVHKEQHYKVKNLFAQSFFAQAENFTLREDKFSLVAHGMAYLGEWVPPPHN